LPQIKAILKVMDLSIKGLSYYKAYIPVAKVLVVMQEQKSLLEAHQNKYQRVLESKGREL
jgi:hypothetical protein